MKLFEIKPFTPEQEELQERLGRIGRAIGGAAMAMGALGSQGAHANLQDVPAGASAPTTQQQQVAPAKARGALGSHGAHTNLRDKPAQSSLDKVKELQGMAGDITSQVKNMPRSAWSHDDYRTMMDHIQGENKFDKLVWGMLQDLQKDLDAGKYDNDPKAKAAAEEELHHLINHFTH